MELADFLIQRAKAASVTRLALDTTAGSILAALALGYRSSGWVVVGALGFFLLSYGEWGLMDRLRTSETSAPNRGLSRLLNALCAFMVAVAAASIAACLLGVWALALGTWIS